MAEFVIVRTGDGGRTWTRIPPETLPPALPNEGAFAGSGTNVTVLAPNSVWIGTGASTRSRVLRSSDGGATWTIADTPIATSASAGIFSIAFRDPLHGVVVGGDYRKESEAMNNAATTSDGGMTWTVGKGLSGFRSVVAYVPGSQIGDRGGAERRRSFRRRGPHLDEGKRGRLPRVLVRSRQPPRGWIRRGRGRPDRAFRGAASAGNAAVLQAASAAFLLLTAPFGQRPVVLLDQLAVLLGHVVGAR